MDMRAKAVGKFNFVETDVHRGYHKLRMGTAADSEEKCVSIFQCR